MGNILRKRTYIGDDYYPQIIDEETFNAVQEMRASRWENMKNKPSTLPKPKPAIPVQANFRFNVNVLPQHKVKGKRAVKPAAAAAMLYRAIEVCEDGQRVMTAEEKKRYNRWNERRRESKCQ